MIVAVAGWISRTPFQPSPAERSSSAKPNTSAHQAALASASRAENEMWDTFENVGRSAIVIRLPRAAPVYSYQECACTPDRRIMSTGDLTTTSYAILGLLAIRPWTTYELAQQMDRSLRSFWPRAQSRIYEEPKRLVAEGLATARADEVGRRRRTIYSITAKGRRVLRTWLAEPGGGPVVEFEALLKVFFAEHATKADVEGNIAAIRAWAEEQNATNIAFARMYRDTGGPFPERLASIILVGRFLVDLADTIANWADWAQATVAGWPDDTTRAEPDWDTINAVAARGDD
jgi:DNA-binding PadR family transcriptional regulator